MKFNDNFLWSASTADFQIEGGLTEGQRGYLGADFVTTGSHGQPRRITLKDQNDRLFSVGVYDTVPQDATFSLHPNEYYPSHQAVDFYHHWKEDIDLLIELGLKAYRFSICWTRIYPNGIEESPNKEGIDFYGKIIDYLINHHIEPVITICHDEIPAYLCDHYDGWLSRFTMDCYMKYVKTLFEHFGKKVKYWITFNEINAVTGYAQLGIKDVSLQSRLQAVHNCMVCTAKVVKMSKEMHFNHQIGTMFSYSALYPATCKPEDAWETLNKRRQQFYYFSDTLVLGGYPSFASKYYKDKNIQIIKTKEDDDLLKNYPIDYLAISYYRSLTGGVGLKRNSKNFVLDGGPNPYLKMTDWGMPIDYLGLRYVLNELYDRYEKPIFIVENGLGAEDILTCDYQIHDSYRIDYIKNHLIELKKAVLVDGVECLGYSVWSSTDVISLSTGEMKKRYGLIYVDMDDQGNGTKKRYKKDSFYWYKNLIATQGEEL